MVSVVIPHKGRDSLLSWQLRELKRQVFRDFEIIVVLDMTIEEANGLEVKILVKHPKQDITIVFSGGRGPNVCRNMGVAQAKNDIVLILGSDCIPDPYMVGEHYYSHVFEKADIVQGYTPFHPDVISPFYDFLDSSGLQAAWDNLRDEDGNFRREISPAFCLTTNYSVSKKILLNEPFDERFLGPAWDDIEFGYRLSRYNTAVKTIFNKDAINYHYHRYNLDSFVQRSRMEGYHRLTLCKIHPEMGWGMVNPFDLRAVKDVDEYEMLSWAKELDEVTPLRNEDVSQLIEKKYQRYAEVCKVFSLKGVIERIKDEHPAMQALTHVHGNSQTIQILSGVNALDMGCKAYAAHTAQWFVAERDDDWSAWSYLGEIELELGNKDDAILAFKKSVEINPGEQWPNDRLREVLE